ncbi:hypothetical protein [Clostridium saccharoperbutylacetonicum]|uniref:hypothetical protein n=1 Tax=Clostridium saccharoperbutylacetonicum TaxID=36745 RepID=UPI0039E8379F
MKITLIKEDKTEIKLSKKKESFLIEQLQFFGAVPSKESTLYKYFQFNGDMETTRKYLGF